MFGFGPLQDNHVKDKVKMVKYLFIDEEISLTEIKGSVSDELIKVSNLFEKGLLTEEEFIDAKKLILKK